VHPHLRVQTSRTRQHASLRAKTRRESRVHNHRRAMHGVAGCRSADGESGRRARALGGGEATNVSEAHRATLPTPDAGGRALEGYLCIGKMEAASRAAACSLKQGSRKAAQASLAFARSIAHDSLRPVCKETTKHVSSRRVEDSTAEGDAYSNDRKDRVSRAEDHGAERESQVFCAAAENIEGCCR
jgi:hypothetical protein